MLGTSHCDAHNQSPYIGSVTLASTPLWHGLTSAHDVLISAV